ncbi:MAG: hypothetical protein WCO02_13275 [Bacteroidota bacterium]
MNRKAVAYSLSLLLLLFFPLIVQQQKFLLNTSEIDQTFSKVWKTSEASRKQYSWKAKTEVTRDDKVMQVLIEEVSHTSNGLQIRKVISNQEAPLPSTIIIRQIAEDQKSKIVAFMSDLRIFLEKYALEDDSTRHSFFSKASISTPDASGQLLVSGSNVLTKGDKLKWWIDTRSYTIAYVTILTTFKGISAEFSATYYLLPDLNYMSKAKILVPSKNMVIKLQFYDFIKR